MNRRNKARGSKRQKTLGCEVFIHGSPLHGPEKKKRLRVEAARKPPSILRAEDGLAEEAVKDAVYDFQALRNF